MSSTFEAYGSSCNLSPMEEGSMVTVNHVRKVASHSSVLGCYATKYASIGHQDESIQQKYHPPTICFTNNLTCFVCVDAFQSCQDVFLAPRL